jgi:hypothetical protein
MDRKLLQYIWDRQLFSASFLQTTASEPLKILDTGRRNPGPGPDFLDARISFGDQVRKGHVALQMISSERYRQGSSWGIADDEMILQVVWKDDLRMAQPYPVVELQPLVPSRLQRTYADWMSMKRLVPCSPELGSIAPEGVYPYLEFMTTERFLPRARQVLDSVKALGMDWPEAFWRAMARGFGHRVNAEAFEKMANTLPYRILLKHRSRVEQIEALILGQAGLLRPDTGDAYARELFAQYGSLRKKYKLGKSCAPVHFQHMRQANFPTVRLAQLSMLVHRVPDLFRMVKDIRDPKVLLDMLNVEASAYWDTHYRFGEATPQKIKQASTQLVSHLLVNTTLPFILAYHLHIGSETPIREALGWLGLLPAENQSIIRAFERAGIPARNMSDAQGLLELHETHCSRLGCAACALGKMLLRVFPDPGSRGMGRLT